MAKKPPMVRYWLRSSGQDLRAASDLASGRPLSVGDLLMPSGYGKGLEGDLAIASQCVTASAARSPHALGADRLGSPSQVKAIYRSNGRLERADLVSGAGCRRPSCFAKAF